jgi:hypothetical protein
MIGQYDRTQSVGIRGNSGLVNALGHDSGVESFMAYTVRLFKKISDERC